MLQNRITSNKNLLTQATITLFITFAFYYDLINHFGNVLKLIFLITLMLFWIYARKGKINSNRKSIIIFLGSVFFIIFRNQSFFHHEYFKTIQMLFILTVSLFLPSYKNNLSGLAKKMLIIGEPLIIAIYVLWAIPSLYAIMYRIWGVMPKGTDDLLKFGYRAGLSSHYSGNATVCAILVICSFIKIIEKKQNRKAKLLFLINLFALILTTKRAHLLFSTAAIVIIYYIENPKKIAGKIFKFSIIGLVAAAVLYIGILYIPVIRMTYERMIKIGTDNESLSRLAYWKLALDLFRKSPILGIGWLGFRYQYRIAFNTYGSRFELLHAHNVYVQTLCETGILGFCFYCVCLFILLKATFNLYKSNLESKDKNAILLGLAIQIFYLFYSLTGNCLYDNTFHFFCLSIVITLSGLDKQKHRRNKYQ